jgi:multimeric flavodoxin WrbA
MVHPQHHEGFNPSEEILQRISATNMKILALIGSPRRKGNTDTLVEHILRGSETKGHTNEKLYLYDYEISPCIDCRSCKSGKMVCTIKDEMQEICQKMEAADLIIFGTPLYWYGPTGKMKLLIDRMRPYIANKKLKGKKALVVTPSEEGEKSCGPLLEMFRNSFEYLGMDFIGKIFVKAYEKGEIEENSRELENAYKVGSSL